VVAPTPERRQLLRKSPLFSRLPDEEIDALLAHAVVERFRAGALIGAKGDPGSSMMAVLTGQVLISVLSVEGKQIVLNMINEGEVVGEIALLDGKERSADMTASTNCELLVIERRSFLPLLERPALTRELLRVLCEKVRRTSEQVEDVLFLDVEARIAKALLRLAQNRGPPQRPGARVALRISQRELGNLVGASRESINKHLQDWKRSGIIGLENGAIVIRDPAALEAFG
jgi:CRP/FNR family cyclic AMP-dependent transcriptional regulator